MATARRPGSLDLPARPDPDGDALSIAELYGRVDRALRQALPGQVWVTGEVKSFSVSSRGHCYIDLVDHDAADDSAAPVLRVVCWASRWSRVRPTLDRLGITFEAGLVVRVRGEIQLYKPRGDISFILSELDTDALLGKVAAARARLIKALVDEGLLDRNRRIPVPAVPLRIGLVASPGTEGFRDFLGQLADSGMAFHVRLAPTQVQGRDAAASVATAVRFLDRDRCDLVVVVRGGGSKSDLATFDAEVVARAVATADTPVWTGIGHTGDQSVADEVANRSFITPTECGQELARRVSQFWASTVAAGLAVGRRARRTAEDASVHLARGRTRLGAGTGMQLGRHADTLEHRRHDVRRVVQHQVATHAARLTSRSLAAARTGRRALDEADRQLVRRSSVLSSHPARRLEVDERQIDQWRRLLRAFDYERQLERGYSLTRGPDGSVLRSVAGLAPGSVLSTRLLDGEVRSVTESVTPLASDRTADPSDPDDEGTHP